VVTETAGLIRMDREDSPAAESESVTAATNGLAAATVGVPEIAPVLESRVRPAGRPPEAIDHV
jgi:hypothetical protein